MTRRLTREDRELWERLQRTVKPLRPEQAAKESAAALDKASKPTRGETPSAPLHAPRRQPHASRLEERSRRRLARGLTEVDARIDLHGMRQERAFATLISFLRGSQARDARQILVITGKGREAGEGRGVLKQAVPMWLSRPEFYDLVVGFAEAGRRHGGSGALYVQLRRRREARRATPAES